MMSPNSFGVVSRPFACRLSWNAVPPWLNGGCPTAPAATWAFCARTAAMISLTVRSSSVARSGSIQMRIL